MRLLLQFYFKWSPLLNNTASKCDSAAWYHDAMMLFIENVDVLHNRLVMPVYRGHVYAVWGCGLHDTTMHCTRRRWGECTGRWQGTWAAGGWWGFSAEAQPLLVLVLVLVVHGHGQLAAGDLVQKHSHFSSSTSAILILEMTCQLIHFGEQLVSSSTNSSHYNGILSLSPPGSTHTTNATIGMAKILYNSWNKGK